MSNQLSLFFTNTKVQIHAQLDATFRSGKLKDIPYRKYVILQLGYMLKDNADRIAAALLADLGKPPLEVNLCVQSPFLPRQGLTVFTFKLGDWTHHRRGCHCLQ